MGTNEWCASNLKSQVTRSGRSTRNELKSTLELIEKVNGKVTGVVLNDVDLKSQPGQYYGRYTY